MSTANQKYGGWRPPLWAIAATAGLIAVGFRARPFSNPPSARSASIGASVPDDGGRLSANAPSEIPARWKDVLLRLYQDISEHRLFALGAGATFYSLLAIFPALAALVAIYGLFSDPRSIATHLDMLSGLLPSGAIDVAKDQLTRVASKGAQALGLAFVIGLSVSLWSANAAMKSLFDTLNVVYGEKEKRGLVKLNVISLAFTVAGIIFVLLAIAAVVALAIALQYLVRSEAVDLIVRIGRWPALFIILALALAFIYRYGASSDKARWRWVTWGSALAALLWLGASVLFSWYAANFGNYNQTYGSLGAVIGFMTWLWISAIAILIGAEVDAELEHQTARGRHDRRAEAACARGAMMADTTGPRQS